jgi:hypothetical protein
MMLDYKKFELYGKTVFEKGVVKPPYSQPSIMQDDSCFL